MPAPGRAGRDVKLGLIVEDGIVEIFVDGRSSIRAMAFDDPGPARIGFLVVNGGVRVKDVRLMPIP